MSPQQKKLSVKINSKKKQKHLLFLNLKELHIEFLKLGHSPLDFLIYASFDQNGKLQLIPHEKITQF